MTQTDWIHVHEVQNLNTYSKVATHIIIESYVCTVVSWVNAHGHLYNSRLISIRLYRSCRIDPLQCTMWVLTRARIQISRTRDLAIFMPMITTTDSSVEHIVPHMLQLLASYPGPLRRRVWEAMQLHAYRILQCITNYPACMFKGKATGLSICHHCRFLRKDKHVYRSLIKKEVTREFFCVQLPCLPTCN